MIIGNGDIAYALQELEEDNKIFFASGVSNSGETDEKQYDREVNLLRSQDWDKHLVYFSSLCVFYSDTRYAKHKRYMEGIVSSLFSRYTIVRLGNITFGTNPHTIINALREKKRKGEEIEVQDVYRYLVDKDEFLHWIKMIPTWSCEMNITGKRLLVKDIIKEYVT